MEMEVNFVSLDGAPLDRGSLFDESWMMEDDGMDEDEDIREDGTRPGTDACGDDDGSTLECNAVDGFEEPQKYQVLLYPKVQRERKQDIPDYVLEAVERQKLTKTETILPAFGQREFASFGEFHAAWGEYESKQWLNYRIRDSSTVLTYNATMAKRKTIKREPVPTHLEYGVRTYRCTHGLYQPSRGTGLRHAKSTRYTACDARIVVEARRSTSPSNHWVAQVVSEVVRHNHKCSKTIFDSYTKASVLIGDADLFKDLHLMVQVSAATTRIRDVIRMRYGVRLTAQQIRNFMRDRLGGRGALANLRLLLQRFASFEGSRCLIIEDEDGLVCGIVLQSRAQRMMFDRYGDNLLLDWTHNTNNAGYYLGALMATSASGSGVSVLDFLCLAQTKDMMRVVFTHFISWYSGAVEKIRSFVIDKDYAEWAVLKELFPLSRVLFCQFHVIKWLVQVVKEGRYGRLSVPVQDSIIAVLRAMVYAATREVYTSQKWLLEHMLSLECPALVEYMKDRWYSCSDMWVDSERGTVFTATNTTSNRLEASWGQVKSILGLKLRFDMCLEAVFTYQTAVFEREIECIETVAGPTSLLRSRSDRFMRPVLAQVSDYCAKHIDEQYAAHSRMIGSYVVTPEAGSNDRFVIEKFMAGGSHRIVNSADWSCSCMDFVTSELPCRHIIFFSRVHVQHEFLPLAALRKRWLLSAAVSMLPELRACTNEVQSLRTGLLLVDPSSLVPPPVHREAEDDDVFDDDLDFLSIHSAKSKRQSASVAHVRLARGEVATGVVLDNIEKRNVVLSEFQEIMTYMMAQSSPRFKSMAAYLREMLDGLLVAFQDIPLTEEDRVEEAISAAMARCELSPQDQIRAMVETAVKARRDGRERTEHDSQHEHMHFGRDVGGSQYTKLPQEPDANKHHHAVETTNASVCDATDAPVSATRDDGRGASDDGRGASDDGRGASDAVSSLSVSCLSEILQEAAVRHAEGIATSEMKPSQLVNQPISYPAPAESRAVGKLSAAAIKRSAVTADLDGGILQKVILRVPMSAGNSKKQKAKNALKGSRRLVHVTQRSECGVDLSDLVQAARATKGVPSVHSKLKEYPLLFNDDWLQKRAVLVDTQYVRPVSFAVNFVIPIALLHRFEVAIQSVANSRPEPVTFDLNAPPVSDQLVARIEAATTVRGFSEENVASFRAFYDALRCCEAYALDVAWVSRCAEGFPTDVRDNVIKAMEQSALDTRFHLSAGNENPPTSIALADVVGHLAADSWLNDTVLVFVLRQIADEIDGVLILDSLRPVCGVDRPVFQLPSHPPAERQIIVFPVNLSKSHWCLICVIVNSNEEASVVLYDPIAQESNIAALRDEWFKYCEPFVRAWCVRDRGKYGVASIDILTTPRQAANDGNSCGIYCIATACDFATQSTRFRSMATLAPRFVGYLRLSFMRSLLCGSDVSSIANEEWAAGVMERLAKKKDCSVR